MIWFFLMGMIAGAVGVILVLMWWFRTHMVKVSADEMIRDMEKIKEEESHE